MSKTSKKGIKSPMQVTAEQEALLILNDKVKSLDKSTANMQAWMKVTQDMFLAVARLSGLDAKALAKATPTGPSFVPIIRSIWAISLPSPTNASPTCMDMVTP